MPGLVHNTGHLDHQQIHYTVVTTVCVPIAPLDKVNQLGFPGMAIGSLACHVSIKSK